MFKKIKDKLRKPKDIDFKLLFKIFLTFFKISPFTFGGGFSMIPILETEMVEKKKWIESKKIVDIFAVAQSVPGAIAVNSATFIGYHLAGIPGALAAALGMVMPTFAIIILLAVVLVSYQSNMYVQSAFKGIRPTVVALIAIAAYKMGKASIKDRTSIVICVIAGITLLFLKSINIFFFIIAGVFLGIVIVSAKDCTSRLTKKENVIKETDNIELKPCTPKQKNK